MKSQFEGEHRALNISFMKVKIKRGKLKNEEMQKFTASRGLGILIRQSESNRQKVTGKNRQKSVFS